MAYKDIVKKISEKFNYDNEICIAIEKALELMIIQHGESELENIIDAFMTTPIFTTHHLGVDKTVMDDIREIMTNDINKHIVFEEQDLYGNYRPGSIYQSQVIFDDDMNIYGERKWIIVSDMKKAINGEKYKQYFGTYINFPYLLHEMNHAYNLLKGQHKKVRNAVYSEEGLIETTSIIEKTDQKYVVRELEKKYLILEEAINELETREMLKNYFNFKSIDDVVPFLNSFNHENPKYSELIIGCMERFRNAIGKQQFHELRTKNNLSVKYQINGKSRHSKIKTKYYKSSETYDYFSHQLYEMYKLKLIDYQLDINEYHRLNAILMVDALAAICNLEGWTLERYETARTTVLNGLSDSLNNKQK